MDPGKGPLGPSAFLYQPVVFQGPWDRLPGSENNSLRTKTSEVHDLTPHRPSLSTTAVGSLPGPSGENGSRDI